MHQYYHSHNLQAYSEDGKFSDEKIPMYQIFNHRKILNKDLANSNEDLCINSEEEKGNFYVAFFNFDV